jgi:hypothetical protein
VLIEPQNGGEQIMLEHGRCTASWKGALQRRTHLRGACEVQGA